MNMSIRNKRAEAFEALRGQEEPYRCEMVSGYVLKSAATSEEGRKLCFMLGTLLTDFLIRERVPDQVVFGPLDLRLDECNALCPDMVTGGAGQEVPAPRLVVEILSGSHIIYDCLDKAVVYRQAGAEEYWLIDLERQFVYTYTFGAETLYRRRTFEDHIESSTYPGFIFSISEILWQDTGCLRELALFYRFRKEIEDVRGLNLVADAPSEYMPDEGKKYTAEAFYEWISVRKHLQHYREMTQLLMGEIREHSQPAFRHQMICGNLYFAVKQYLNSSHSPYMICFPPTAVELKGKALLDSVVRPDLFLVPRDTAIEENICQGTPLWVIEVTEPSSASEDYIDKLQIYQYHGVGSYWIVNDWKRQVMVTEAGDIAAEEGVPGRIYDFDEWIEVPGLEGLAICMDEILRIA